jgi:hypothetical protein
MNFRFTDSEVHTLVELLSLATLVAEWNQTTAFQGKMASINALENKIFEYLLHAGYSDVIEFNELDQRHQVTEDFEKKSSYMLCYDEFRQESFWEELVIRLADRDLAKRIGFDAWNILSEEQRRVHTVELEKRLWKEFEKFGVDHLHLIHLPHEG